MAVQNESTARSRPKKPPDKKQIGATIKIMQKKTHSKTNVTAATQRRLLKSSNKDAKLMPPLCALCAFCTLCAGCRERTPADRDKNNTTKNADAAPKAGCISVRDKLKAKSMSVIKFRTHILNNDNDMARVVFFIVCANENSIMIRIICRNLAMVYDKKCFSNFDKALLAFSAAVLIFALFFLPKESFVLIRQELYVTQNWTEYLKNGEVARLSREFEAANPHISLVFKDSEGDVVARTIPSPGFSAPQQESQTPQGGQALQGNVEVASFIQPLFYNITMLENAGFDRPPKTRSEFIAAARKINEDAAKKDIKDIKGFAFSGNVFEDILPWFWSAGVKDDWSSKAATDTLEFLKKLADEGIITEAMFDEKGAADKRALFIEGKCAFYIGSTLDIAALEEAYPPDEPAAFEWSVTAIPPPDKYAGKPVFNVSSWEIGISPEISSESEKKEVAFLYVEFIKERRGVLAEAAGANPDIPFTVNSGRTVRAAGAGNEPVRSKARMLFEGADIIHDAAFFGDTDRAAQVFKNELTKLWSGEQSPKESAAALNKEFSK